jgi:hypothetical protein
VAPSEARRWASDGIAQALERAAARGVDVAVRSAAPPGVPGHVPDPAAGEGCNLVAIADDAECLMSLGLADGDGPSEEWSLWSTHADLVRLLAQARAPMVRVVRQRPTNDA